MRFCTLALVAVLAPTTEAVQISSENKIKMRSQIDQAIDQYLEQTSYTDADNKQKAEWGFLKNIVNIDRFFSGPSA